MVEKLKLQIKTNSPAIITSVILGLFFIRPLFKFQSLFWGTPALQFIPWRIFAFEEITKGNLPFFNPYNGLNAPLMANYQSALFYPPGWLLFILGIFGGNLSIAWGFGVLNYLHLVWAAVGMMLLTRMMGMNKFGQTISCLSFACSQVLLARQGFISMIWTAVWFPWLIYFIEKRVQGPSKKVSLGWGLSVGLMLLAGHAQWSFYQLLFCEIWWFWRVFLRKSFGAFVVKQSFFLIRDSLLGIGLACVQLLPTTELLINSQRASAVDYELAMTYSFWQWRILTLFLPNIFGNPGNGDYWGYGAYWEDAFYFGVLPAVMLFLSLKIFLKRIDDENEKGTKRTIRFLWVSALIALILAMGKNTPVFPILYLYIPGFDMFQAPARFMIIVTFSFSLLAGLGSQFWTKPEGKSLYWTRLGTAGSAAIVGTSFVIHRIGLIEKESIPVTFFITGIFLLLVGVLSLTSGMEGNRKNIWAIAVFSVLALDLLTANNKIIPWIDSDLYQESQISRTDLLVNSEEKPVYFYGENDLYNLKFNKFLKFENFNNKPMQYELRENIVPDINVLDHIPLLNNFDPLLSARYAEFMKYLGELPDQTQKYWLQDLGISYRGNLDNNNEAYFEPIYSEWKPVEWTHCALYSNGIEESLDLLNKQIQLHYVHQGQQNRCAIIEEKSGTFDSAEPGAKGIIQIKVINPQKISVEVDANSPGWVTFKRSWYPGWRIKMDGGEAKNALIADVNFMGIDVPKGKHSLELFYQPTVFYAGLAVSIMSVVAVIILKRFDN